MPDKEDMERFGQTNAFPLSPSQGLTKREYFAMHFMAAQITREGQTDKPYMATVAIQRADALIAALMAGEHQ